MCECLAVFNNSSVDDKLRTDHESSTLPSMLYPHEKGNQTAKKIIIHSQVYTPAGLETPNKTTIDVSL